MGSELLDESAPPPSKSFTERFKEAYPFYHITLGMPYDEFWNDDVTLVKHYRKAYEMRCEREEYLSWRQGAHFYNALCCAAPIIRTSFSKGSVSAHPYPDWVPLNTPEQPEETERENIDVAKFHAFASKFNEKFKT